MNPIHTQSASELLLADTQGNTLLAIGILIVIAGTVGLWFVSRVTPKGTLLAIAVAIYIVSWIINPGTDRALHGLVGLLRMLGFVGGVLGIVDLFKKRSR